MTTENDTGPAKRRVPVWLALALMAVALVLAVLVLARVAGPLYALLFPLDVPVPGGAQEIEHVKPKKGDEYWIFRSSMTGEEVAAFYEQEGSVCRYTPRSTEETPFPVVGPYSVAHCTGSDEFAGLGISWEVYIHAGYSEAEGPTVFRVYKYGEVN